MFEAGATQGVAPVFGGQANGAVEPIEITTGQENDGRLDPLGLTRPADEPSDLVGAARVGIVAVDPGPETITDTRRPVSMTQGRRRLPVTNGEVPDRARPLS